MRRREVIAGLALPFVPGAWAQQPGRPVIGYLNSRSPVAAANIVAAFRLGLKEEGFVDGQNVAIESRFAEGHLDRLPTLAGDLVRRNVNVLVATGGTSSAVAAKPIVQGSIPMVFAMGGDPVRLGVVSSLARPTDNITGVHFLVNGLAAKQVEVLHDLVPKAATIGFLIDPNDTNSKSDMREVQAATDALGLKLIVVNASREEDLEAAFASLVQLGAAALIVQIGPFMSDQTERILPLAARHQLPAIYSLREIAAGGGLISYGTSITEANRQLGIYTGRVLKGARPADMPVIQSSKFELVVNLKTARALGITIPDTLLARADEVIE